MFGKSQNLDFQCLEKPKFRIPMFGKSLNLEFQCLEKLISLEFLMFKKSKI